MHDLATPGGGKIPHPDALRTRGGVTGAGGERRVGIGVAGQLLFRVGVDQGDILALPVHEDAADEALDTAIEAKFGHGVGENPGPRHWSCSV